MLIHLGELQIPGILKMSHLKHLYFFSNCCIFSWGKFKLVWSKYLIGTVANCKCSPLMRFKILSSDVIADQFCINFLILPALKCFVV